MHIDYVFDVIRSEREYQKRRWPNSKKPSVAEEILLLRKHLKDFEENYYTENDGSGLTPEVCLHDIRKMAALLIRAMENHGAIKRL